MRIMTLDEMLDELRAEARISQNVAHGLHKVDALQKLLRRVQEELYEAYEWPALATVRTTTIEAGTRYASYPDGIDFTGIKTAYTREATNLFRPLRYGIGIEELNLYDSDANERAFPIRSWQNYLSPEGETINQNMFEVWPIPDRQAVVRFAGKRALLPLTDGAHSSTIDGPLIVLHAAVEILAAQKSEDAQLKLQKARDRADILKRRQNMADNRRVNLSTPSRPAPLRPGIDYIP